MKPHPILSIMNPLTRALAKASRYAFALSAFALGTHADTLTIDGDLDVEGTATIQESLLVRGDGGETPNVLTVLKNGNVGIGEDAPDVKLVVSGDARIEGALHIQPAGDISMGPFTAN